MFALRLFINLTRIMLIFNGLNAVISKAETSFTTISSLTTTSGSSEVALQALSGYDSINIRHERSKQRRHSSDMEKEKEQTRISRNLYEATTPEMQQLHVQFQIKNVAAIDEDSKAGKELQFFSNSYNLTNFFGSIDTGSHSIGVASLTPIESFKNITRHTKNANKSIALKKGSNTTSILQPTTASTYHLTPTTTIKTVTHKIRKLHKKKIVESLRQLHIEKFNTNGGHLSKSHHRSLLEAEQLQQQAQMKSVNNMIATSSTSASNEHENQKNQKNQLQNEQQQKQWQWLTETTVALQPERVKGIETETVTTTNALDKVNMATNDIDTNESVNDSNLPDMLLHVVENAAAIDDDDDDDDTDADVDIDDDSDGVDGEHNDNDELMDVLYQNDEGVTNADNDELMGTSFKPLLDNKYEKHFKNYSSEFIKEIDNNVDLEENETFNLSQQHKDFAGKNLYQNYSGLIDAINSTYETFNSTIASVVDAPSNKHLPVGTTSQHSFLYEMAEINFNDPGDFNQDQDFSSSSSSSYSSPSSKDLVMDDAEDSGGMHANEFPLSNTNTDLDTETEVNFEIASDDEETNHFLEGVVDAANSEEIYDWDEISRSNRRDLMHGRDVVTKFLQIVETQHSLGSNCEAGTSLNLGEGVVDRYAQDRFRVEAEVAVNRANMLTRIFKMTSSAAQADVNLLHASVLSMVEFDDDIFAAGNCFDWNEHPSQPGLFCPFAYRLPPPNLGAILAKDLSMEYHYLGNTSEWFFQARKNAEKVIARNEQYLKAFHLYSNKTDERIEDDTLAVKYEDGRWSKPYYDCGGGNIWMLTYTVPFFGYENSTYHFKGTSGIDIDLRRVDIDQCPQRNVPGSTKPLNIFAGTDKCKQRTTMCEAIQGLGFRRGSYKCVCRKGYYFPDTTSQHKYFNGSLLEEEYEKLMLGKNSTYNIVNEYECLPCAEGCDSCEDGSPCIAALNWPMRTSILALACIVIGLLPPAAWFTFRYQQVKVVRAASPALLRVIALGAFFIYCTNIVMYPNPNLYTCTARIWLREIGFSLTYGALMLKTWRISVIFRVRSAKAVKITDAALLKRLGCICGAIGTCLLVRTLVSPPGVVVGRTADDLKAFLCKTDWWDYTFTSMEVVFLAWGVRLCIMVRKAPSEFNESRFISMAIYNEFLLTCFLNVSMLFLQSPANPDLLYIIFFCHTQLTITLLLALIFGSKVYIVLRSGKSHQDNIAMGAKSSGAKFNFRPQVRTFANPSSVTTSTVPMAATTSAENKLSDQEALEEIRQLSVQLQRIQEMAPPKGVAVMTISSLLDGLKTPGSMVMVAAAANAAGLGGAAAAVGGGGGGGHQLTVPSQKPEASLPLLSLNSEMQKYQQLHIPTTTNNNVAAIKTIPAITMPSTQLTFTSSTPTHAATSKIENSDEKAVNTDIIGNCIAEEEFKKQQQHIICKRCYDKCKDLHHHQQLPLQKKTASTLTVSSPAKLSKCQMLGSPQQEGSLSFKNIKLDCMCSQSDDLDQRTQQPEQQQNKTTTKRVTKRTAATNTPPCTARKRTEQTYPVKDIKTQSTISLPSGKSRDSALVVDSTTKPISYISQQNQQKQQQQQQQQQQQICDNCKNKFKRKTSYESKTEKSTKKSQYQHRKLSRLSSKCNKLLEDIEKSKSKPATATATTTTYRTSAKGQRDSNDDIQYSTDDIIFYTTTDTSDDSSDESNDNDITDDSDNLEVKAMHENTSRDDDLSSNLSLSKSETRVPTKLKPQTATIEFKCISLSLGSITATSSLTLATTTTATTTSSSTSQPETVKTKTALLEPNAVHLTTSAKTVSTTSSQQQSQQPQQQQQPQTSTNGSNGSSNGKAKRPDKLVLNLNDRSKFTKEVSV